MKGRKAGRSLSGKIKILLTVVMVPLVILIVFLIITLSNYSNKYDSIIENLRIASEFSFDFEKKLDHSMYRHIVGNPVDPSEYEPFVGIDEARDIIERLDKTTTNPESREMLRMIQVFLNNLERTIIDIRDHNYSYDSNMGRLEGIIQPNTELVSEWAYQYIHSETLTLTKLSESVREEMQGIIISIIVFTVALLAVILMLSISMTNSLTKPIQALSKNIRQVGKGNFDIMPLEIYDDELRALSDTFSLMVKQIEVLMDDIKTEQQNLRNTELRLLQAQINPHFLYNTFDTIIWLVESERNQDVIEVVDSLSTFFRTTLSQGRDTIAIREEGMHIRSYLEIQKFRYQDIMSYYINIDPQLEEYLIPKLTLQPLVENALYHGIKNRRGGGEIRVEGELHGKDIVLRVFDNGIGMTVDQLEAANRGFNKEVDSGYGLSNVNERLRLYSGEGYGLSIESEYGVGTTVTARLITKENQL